MKKCVFEHLGVFILFVFAVTASGQTTETGTATPQGRVVGVVTSVDKAANQIAVKTDTGETNVVTVTTSSSLLRLPPGETSAQKAEKITLENIAVGDRLFARGTSGSDGKTLEARQVVVTNAAAAAVSQVQPERDDAVRQRPMVGRIASIDAQKKEITLQPRGRENATPATIALTDATRVFRYAPDSLDIKHASRSSLDQMRVGDQLRALGERNTDGTRFTATEIISGSMARTVGQVVGVDPAKKELTIKTNQGQTITVAIGERSSLRRVTPEVAASFAARPGRAGGGQEGQEGRRRERRERPAGADGEARRTGEGRPGRGGRGFQEILERLPAITLSDLKKGDSVFVSGSEGTDASRVTAIMLITGDAAFMERFLQRGPNRGPQSPGLPGDVIGGGVGPAEPPPNNP